MYGQDLTSKLRAYGVWALKKKRFNACCATPEGSYRAFSANGIYRDAILFRSSQKVG